MACKRSSVRLRYSPPKKSPRRLFLLSGMLVTLHLQEMMDQKSLLLSIRNCWNALLGGRLHAKRTFLSYLSFLGFLHLAAPLLSQTPTPTLWLQFYTQHRSKNHLFWEADAGYRGDALGTRATTALARMGAGLHWQAGYATAGIAWFESIDTDANAPDRAEFRLYQKLLLRQPFKKIELNHIYRAEERWLQRPNHSAFDFQLRLRYLLQLNHSFEKLSLLSAIPYATANNEIFLVPNARVFSQYRLYGGAGLVWHKKWKLELGYLRVWLPTNSTGTRSNAVVRTSVTYTW